MSSDQKFTTFTADGQVKTVSGGSLILVLLELHIFKLQGLLILKRYAAGIWRHSI